MDWGIFRPSRATAICLVLLVFSFSLMTLRLTKTVQALRSFLFYWVAPTQEAATACIQFTGDLGLHLADLVRTHQENVLLREKVKNYSLLESQFNEMTLENERLKRLLELKSTLPYQMIPAVVSGRDTQNWMHAIWVNRGTKDGVQPDDTVIATQSRSTYTLSGLVGRVLESAPSTSKVLLITDPLSSVAIFLPRLGEQGLLSGQGSFEPIVEYLDPGAAIESDDEVVTSGLGGIFPAGIPVGHIHHLYGTPLGFKRADLVTAVSLNKIREVLILKNPGKSAGTQAIK